MDSSLPILSLSAAAVAGAAAVFPKLQARLALSRAKHRSLTGHSKMSKMVARLVPHYEFDINDFFRSDGAPAEIATFLIGYSPKKDQVAQDLQFALRDADPGVRANAARANSNSKRSRSSAVSAPLR